MTPELLSRAGCASGLELSARNREKSPRAEWAGWAGQHVLRSRKEGECRKSRPGCRESQHWKEGCGKEEEQTGHVSDQVFHKTKAQPASFDSNHSSCYRYSGQLDEGKRPPQNSR